MEYLLRYFSLYPCHGQSLPSTVQSHIIESIILFYCITLCHAHCICSAYVGFLSNSATFKLFNNHLWKTIQSSICYIIVFYSDTDVCILCKSRDDVITSWKHTKNRKRQKQTPPQETDSTGWVEQWGMWVCVWQYQHTDCLQWKCVSCVWL